MSLDRFHNLTLSIGSMLGWRRRSAPAAAAWGDGLADQTLANVWYPSTWDEIGADELVFLIPSLTGSAAKAAAETARGPGAVVRRALGAQVYRTACALRKAAGDLGDGSAEALDVIAGSGVLTTIDPFETWAEGLAAADGSRDRGLASPETYRALDPATNRDACLFELAVISCLDRMHRDARGPTAAGGWSGTAVTLPDALLGSIHATLNAAYVYPQFACVQELLSVGAWLGHLVKGRPAYMPVFVAAYLEAELAPDRTMDASAGGRCTRILRSHAEQAVGLERLHSLARRVRMSGRPVLVKPRPMPGLGFTPYLWSASLSKDIARRVEAQLFTA